MKTILALALVAFAGFAQAEVWTGLGDGSSFEDADNWDPSTNTFAGTIREINGPYTVTRDVTANPDRTHVLGGATLNILSGSHSDSKSGTYTRNHVGDGSAGTVNMSGGTYGIGHLLAIAHTSNGDGTFNLTGGDLNVSREGKTRIGGYGGVFSRTHSISIGGNSDGSNVIGLMEISGGSLKTRGGLMVGKNGTLSIIGSGASTILLGGSNTDNPGCFGLSADGLLKASVDAGGVSKIFVEEAEAGSAVVQSAVLQAGSELNLTNTTAYGGTWTLLEVENGDITNNGLTFASSVDTNVWSFAVDNTGANGKLTITAAGDPVPVIPRELVGHWTFDDANGNTAVDSSEYGNDGTVDNALWTVGMVDGALYFDGTGNVELPSDAFSQISDEVTVSFWAYGDAGLPNNSAFYAAAGTKRALNMHLPHSSTVYWDAGGSAGLAGYDRINKGATVSELSGNWNHWIFTKNATNETMKIYLNSDLWHSGTGKTIAMDGITAAYIGGQSSGTYYKGVIDDVRLYNYEISAGDIFAISRPSWHVEVEDYEAGGGGDGLRFQDTEDLGGGQNLGWTSAGEWLDYTINIETTGLHRIDFRVASPGGAAGIDIISGGSSIGTVAIPDTGGYQTWQTVSAFVDFSSVGPQTLRLELLSGNFNLNWFSYEVAPDPIALTVGNTLKQQMRYGIDYERLWYWSGTAAARDRYAEWSVDDCDVDYVRVAISARYEITEGTYEEDAYFDADSQRSNDRIIPMMRDMQAANPDIKFFASPRPLDESTNDNVAWQPYPQWITGSTGSSSNFSFDEVKCSQYLLRYLLMMKHYGFKITYLDLTNEWNYINATDYRDISGLFDAYLLDPWEHSAYPGVTLVADDIPLLVGASAWSYTQGKSWLSGAYSQLRRDAIDIVSSHNTDKGGTAQDVADKVETLWPGEGKEIWNTEVHGWKSTSSADEVLTFAYMMECINAGFSGLNGWLAVGTSNQGHCYIVSSKRSVKYYIFKKLTTTSNRGYALEVNEPDEFKVYWDSDPDQADADSAVSALIRGNLMTVWVLNHSHTDYPVTINPTGRTISDEPIKFTRWSQIDGVAVEGEIGSVPALTNNSAFAIVQDNSAYCFEILLEPETVPYARVEAESYNGSNPGSPSTEACSDTGGGLNLNNINDGNWTRYDDIDLDHAESIRLRVAALAGQADGKIEIRLDSATGELIGKVAVPATGGWQNWCTIETPLSPTTGTHDLYLKYVEADSNQAASGIMFNLNWFELTQTESPSSITEAPVSGTQVTLTWNAVPGAIGYTVKRSTSKGGSYSIVDDTITATTFIDTGLTAGVTYYYVIVARYGFGDESDESGEVVAVPSDPIVVEDLNFEPLTMNPAGDQADIELQNSEPGHMYQGQEREDLATGDWMDVGSPMPGNGGVIIFDFPVGPTDTESFYRITIERQ